MQNLFKTQEKLTRLRQRVQLLGKSAGQSGLAKRSLILIIVILTLAGLGSAAQAVGIIPTTALKKSLESKVGSFISPAPIKIKEFAIADHLFTALSETQRAELASRLGFIWSGDYYAGNWRDYNPSLLVGHYVTINGFDTGRSPRCVTNNDCFNSLTGYTCQFPRPNNRYYQWWVDGEGICERPWGYPGWGSCATNSDCAISELTSAGGLPYPGECDVINHVCRYSIQQKRAIEFNYWQEHYRPDWILYRCSASGEPLPGGQHPDNVAWIPGGAQIPVNYTNASVREEYKRRISEVYDRNPGRYTVLSIDNVYPTNRSRACGVFNSDGSFRRIFQGKSEFNVTECRAYRGFCDMDYVMKINDWLQDLRKFSKKYLNNSKLMINLVNHAGIDYASLINQPVPADHPYLSRYFYSTVDGILDESGFTQNENRQGTIVGKPLDWSYAHNASTEQTWTNQKGYAELANSLGLYYFNKNGVAGLYSMSEEGKKQAAEWAFASFLISNPGNMSFYFCSNPDNWQVENILDWPQLNIDYGRPCDPMRTTDNPLVFRRTYNHAFVIAHTGDSLSADYEATLPTAEFYEWNELTENYDRRVESRTVTTAYQRGYVLYTPENLCDRPLRER
ncbi:hypothetical protein KKF05_04565 [Patescibacteria group bacterium]|nr:hypothetical protein [Patescibacteria group bacterium]MBU1916015.1 hypothetical protein [Patescibacteria group bacterium]